MSDYLFPSWLYGTEKTEAPGWHQKHVDSDHQGKLPYAGVNGLHLVYEVRPSSLGPLVYIKCAHCGKGQDITDTSDF